MEPSVVLFWKAFVDSEPSCRGLVPSTAAFGDTADMQTSLADLVVAGTKRATASLLKSYGDEPLPQTGAFFIVVDGRGVPRCVCQTINVEVRPFSAVDEIFAAEEGEGDLTLEWWRAAHRSFFERQAERDGVSFDEDSAVVLERFNVVWPTLQRRAD